jgi:cytochrome c
MPFGEAQSVSVDETYAITAFLMYSNGLVDDDFVLSEENFTEIAMPNVDGFYVDDRAEAEYPLFSAAACMENCLTATPTVTKRAIELNVTPEDSDGKPAGTLPMIFAQAEGATDAPAEATAEAAPEMVEDAPAEAVAEAATEAAVDPELIAAGEKVFKKCAACHKVGDGAKNAVGPMLNGIVNKAAGTVDGFKYSKPMAEAGAGGMIWDAATLDAYLTDPKGFIKGNRMSFAGLKKEEDRAAVIAWLSTLSE